MRKERLTVHAFDVKDVFTLSHLNLAKQQHTCLTCRESHKCLLGSTHLQRARILSPSPGHGLPDPQDNWRGSKCATEEGNISRGTQSISSRASMNFPVSSLLVTCSVPGWIPCLGPPQGCECDLKSARPISSCLAV